NRHPCLQAFVGDVVKYFQPTIEYGAQRRSGRVIDSSFEDSREEIELMPCSKCIYDSRAPALDHEEKECGWRRNCYRRLLLKYQGFKRDLRGKVGEERQMAGQFAACPFPRHF